MSTIMLNEDNYIRKQIRFHVNISKPNFIIYDNNKTTQYIFLKIVNIFMIYDSELK